MRLPPRPAQPAAFAATVNLPEKNRGRGPRRRPRRGREGERRPRPVAERGGEGTGGEVRRAALTDGLLAKVRALVNRDCAAPCRQGPPEGREPVPMFVLHFDDTTAATAWEDFLPKLVADLAGEEGGRFQPSSETVGGTKVLSLPATGLPVEGRRPLRPQGRDARHPDRTGSSSVPPRPRTRGSPRSRAGTNRCRCPPATSRLARHTSTSATWSASARPPRRVRTGPDGRPADPAARGEDLPPPDASAERSRQGSHRVPGRVRGPAAGGRHRPPVRRRTPVGSGPAEGAGQRPDAGHQRRRELVRYDHEPTAIPTRARTGTRRTARDGAW